jgi:ABC-2 family transporter protein
MELSGGGEVPPGDVDRAEFRVRSSRGPAIPVLVPAALASYSVVGERLQGTLEPVLSTPVRREEPLLGKALAAFVPSAAVAYTVFALFVAVVELFAAPGVAPALIRGPDLLAQLVFTSLLATWSIWVGIAISARSGPARPRSPRRAVRVRAVRPRTTDHWHQVIRDRPPHAGGGGLQPRRTAKL